MQAISNGSQTATIGTKHQLYTSNAANTYALIVDTNNMVIGDRLELFVDVACESGGTHRQAYYVTFSHQQADPAKLSVPVLAPYGATFSLKQVAGTGSVFKWCVVAV